MAHAQEQVRKPVVSGQFYPSDAKTLKKMVRQFLSQTHSQPDPNVTAIIVPHAGYPYSGAVAAEAYKTVEGRRFDRVVVVAFLHQVFLGGVLVDDVDYYETPLGRVPVDRSLAKKIRGFGPALAEEPPAGFKEHSLEVQLPFLQETVPDLKIVPVYLGEQSRANMDALAGALEKYLKDSNTLLVFSTDLSHFHSYDDAVRLDKKAIQLIESCDVAAFIRADQKGDIEACGMGPVGTSLLLAGKMGWSGPSLLRYANSGDVTGDHGSVVGYAAMVFKTKGEMDSGQGLSLKDQREILGYSRAVLKAKLEKKPEPKLSVAASMLDETRGIFVTLKKRGQLRGCIGQILGQKPLRAGIHDMTLAAAFKDPRFSPLTLGELEDVQIHISILTPPAPVKSYKDIRLGVDGIIVSHGWNKGVYLPEVATETGWDQRTFFESCAIEKAGIAPADLANASIEVFQTEGFEEASAVS